MKSFMTIGLSPKHICACSAYMDPDSNINNLKIRDMNYVRGILGYVLAMPVAVTLFTVGYIGLGILSIIIGLLLLADNVA